MRLSGSPVARARTKTASERSSSVASDWTSRTARKRRIDRSGSEPREPREEGGEDERQELDATRVIAARGGALAVLADRLEHGAEGRVEDALEGGDRRGDERQGEVVEGERRVERDRDAGERQRRQGDPAEAVVAAGPVGEVESDEVEELGERERQHREVDAAPAQAEEADHRAARRREAEPRREPEPQRADLELRERDTGAIGAEPPVGGVAEGEQPRVAVEEVEAEGEEAVDQDLRGERLVRHEVREDREDDEERDDGVGRDPASGASHCNEGREPATLRGWPETRRDPAPFLVSLLIP